MILRQFYRFPFSKLSQNLKLLNLKIPTSQQQIKTSFRELAKIHHPDTLKQNSTKQSQQLFVQITTAYNYLKQVDEKQLTAENQEYDINVTSETKQKFKTKQEELRHETYEYFRKRQEYVKKKKDPDIDKPLYQTVPELFIGTGFVLILFGEWFYKTIMKTQSQFKDVKKEKQSLIYQNVFKGFNSVKRFNSPSESKIAHHQSISQKQGKHLKQKLEKIQKQKQKQKEIQKQEQKKPLKM